MTTLGNYSKYSFCYRSKETRGEDVYLLCHVHHGCDRGWQGSRTVTRNCGVVKELKLKFGFRV